MIKRYKETTEFLEDKGIQPFLNFRFLEEYFILHHSANLLPYVALASGLPGFACLMLCCASIHTLVAPEKQRNCAWTCVTADCCADTINLNRTVQQRESFFNQLGYGFGVIYTCGV